MAKRNNTKKVSTESGLKLIADICHKADGNELLFKALKKLANMSQKNLATFLGEVQILFGRLKRVVSDISLEATESFNTRDFFKTKDKNGIFAYVDNDIFNWFDGSVQNSPAKELASYEFTEGITEENIVGDAKAGNIYEEVDLAHIKQICERHIIKGEKLFKNDGSANLFWIRNKTSGLCKVRVNRYGGGWYVIVSKFNARLRWNAGSGSFFRN